jgi:hypothetical protein
VGYRMIAPLARLIKKTPAHRIPVTPNYAIIFPHSIFLLV